jgi:hypothetical protein
VFSTIITRASAMLAYIILLSNECATFYSSPPLMNVLMNFNAYIKFSVIYFTCQKALPIEVWSNHVEIVVIASIYIFLIM